LIGFDQIDGEVIPIVFFLINEEEFLGVCKAKMYLQELDPENFRGVYPGKPREAPRGSN